MQYGTQRGDARVNRVLESDHEWRDYGLRKGKAKESVPDNFTPATRQRFMSHEEVWRQMTARMLNATGRHWKPPPTPASPGVMWSRANIYTNCCGTASGERCHMSDVIESQEWGSKGRLLWEDRQRKA